MTQEATRGVATGPVGSEPFPRRAVVLCDAAAATGLGHFVRCGALARQLAGTGTDVHLLLPGDSLPQAVDRARASGWRVSVGGWAPDDVLRSSGPATAVIVDSYRVDGSWITDLHERLAASGGVLAVIDDLADRAFGADLVVNQNVGAERLHYPRVREVLSGPRYAMLRPEFPRRRQAALEALAVLPDRPRRILVLFGGTDASGMALIAARAARMAFPEAEVRAVAPLQEAPSIDPDITFLHHVENIHDEMLGADLVLSGGGSTLWELCCLARPAAVVAVAANQLPAYDQMSSLGAILPVGRGPVRDTADLAQRLRDRVRAPGALRTAAENAARLTDGRGAERVAGALTRLTGRGLPISAADAD